MTVKTEKSVYKALCYYSNVHRGSGYNSQITTELFEEARRIVLDYAGKSRAEYDVLFCSPFLGDSIKKHIAADSFSSITTSDGLQHGVSALILKKQRIRKLKVVLAGGGTARLVSPQWVVWSRNHEKLEAGTPPIMNIISFAASLLHEKDSRYEKSPGSSATAKEMLYEDDLTGFTGKELYDKLSESKIGNGILVPTCGGEKPFVNFDYAASTPCFKPILDTWNLALMQNDSVQKHLIAETRKICSDFCQAPEEDYDILFTANTTESLNVAATNIVSDRQSIVLTTILEHTSNDLPWRMAGDGVVRAGINKEGLIDLQEIERILKSYNESRDYGNKRIVAVSISCASNVLGVYNPVEDISEIAHRYGAVLVVDAAQMASHSAIQMKNSAIDCLAFSAHKVYAPFGCGVLIARKGLIHHAGDIQLLKENELKNAAGIAALGKALVLLKRIGMDVIGKHEQELTAFLLKEMSAIKNVTVYGIKEPGSPSFSHKGSVIPFTVEGIMADQVAREMASEGIGIRSGCHCAHILVKHILGVGPFLAGFQRIIVTLFPRLKLPGVARISYGIGNSKQEAEVFLAALRRLAAKPKNLQYKDFADPMKNFTGKVTRDIYYPVSNL